MTRWLLVVVALAACGKSDRRVKRDRDAGVTVGAPDPGGKLAAPTEEIEPNASEAEATPAPPGHVLRGTLDGEADVDVYKVTAPAAGQLRAMLTGIEGVDLILELRDAAGTVLAKSDRGPARTVEGVPGYGVLPGDYFVVVKEFVKPRPKPKKSKKKKGAKAAPDAGVEGRIGPSPVYELTVELLDAPVALHEVEPNDDPGTAVEVLLADTVRGWIGWSGDVDLWKLSLEGVAEQYAIDLDVSGVDGLALDVEVLDAGGERILGRAGGKGASVAIRGLVPVGGAAAPPWHYVRIAADRSNPEATYELRFTARLREPDEEAEPNDDAERATSLSTEVTQAGAMRATWASGDVDVFRLEPQVEPQLLDVTIEPPSGVDLAFELGAPGQPPLAIGTAAGGQKARAAGVPVPVDTPLVLTLRGSTGKKKEPIGEARPYRVVWALTPAAGDPMPPEERLDEPMPPEEQPVP